MFGNQWFNYVHILVRLNLNVCFFAYRIMKRKSLGVFFLENLRVYHIWGDANRKRSTTALEFPKNVGKYAVEVVICFYRRRRRRRVTSNGANNARAGKRDRKVER